MLKKIAIVTSVFAFSAITAGAAFAQTSTTTPTSAPTVTTAPTSMPGEAPSTGKGN